VATLPDILVLGGGGRQGDAWLTGVLAGIEDSGGFDLRSCDYFVGTSAGAVVAARLAAGEVLRRPRERGFPTRPEASSKRVGAASGGRSPLPNWAVTSAMAIAAPFADIGLRITTRPGRGVRAAALRAVPNAGMSLDNLQDTVEAGGARFDGRLRVVAVDRMSGERVVFGAPGASPATVAQAVAASCAVPLMFEPVAIGERDYVDGAVWSATNADVAPVDRDAVVLVLNPSASRFGPFSVILRAASRAAMLIEASALIARGARVHIIAPDRNSAVSIGSDLMSSVGLEPTVAAGYAQGLQF
jgi:NTE family protein